MLNVTAGTDNEIIQENQYYPFGMNQEGTFMNDAAVKDTKYQYNGKELNDDFGLGWSDYGARWYDASIGRWNGVDPLGEKYMNVSGYVYALNNPVLFIDPDGREVTKNKEKLKSEYEDSKFFNDLIFNPDDYYVFDQNGHYVRTEKNDKPDQIVIEDSKSGKRQNVQFNDPKHDSQLLKNTLNFWGKDAYSMILLFFVSDGDINSMMEDSKVKYKNAASRWLFTLRQSVGGYIDFSVYQFPVFVAEKTGSASTWQPNDLGLTGGGEKRSPFFIFGNDKATAYNWLDGGNWLWGNAVNRLGGSKENANNWARSFNKGDSAADLKAISNGWSYQAKKR
ncbi:RHS repeat domain-containing protein [Haliscomenobacter hydrossis]|uniref:RHS repeat domain-containing protein n=1 Tax=Haliscomenobacter hydrossis TaxID=2350 RepID=UPI001FE06CA3|nr:RHS repeat-associated core domain-containing protein [Haliscomenobacter hydrossis]